MSTQTITPETKHRDLSLHDLKIGDRVTYKYPNSPRIVTTVYKQGDALFLAGVVIDGTWGSTIEIFQIEREQEPAKRGIYIDGDGDIYIWDGKHLFSNCLELRTQAVFTEEGSRGLIEAKLAEAARGVSTFKLVHELSE